LEQEHSAAVQTCSRRTHQHQSLPVAELQDRAASWQPCVAPSGEYEPSSPGHLSQVNSSLPLIVCSITPNVLNHQSKVIKRLMLNACKVTTKYEFKITNSDVTLVVGCHKILYSQGGCRCTTEGEN